MKLRNWYYEHDSREPYVVEIGGERVCTMESMKKIAHDRAKLIAAAPFLFQALQELTREIEGVYVGSANDPDSECERVLIHLVKQANMALKKAGIK